MICASCGSEKLSRYEGKLVIHFPEPKGSNKSVVWIFPEMWFCLDCGNAGVSIRGGANYTFLRRTTKVGRFRSRPILRKIGESRKNKPPANRVKRGKGRKRKGKRVDF